MGNPNRFNLVVSPFRSQDWQGKGYSYECLHLSAGSEQSGFRGFLESPGDGK